MRADRVLAAALIGAGFLCRSSVSCPARVAEPDTVTATLQLRHMQPSRVVEALRTTRSRPHADKPGQAVYPAGVSAVTADDPHMTLTVQGSDKGIADLREVVALLDVEPTSVVLQMRVLRSQSRASGRNAVSVVSAPTVVTLNNVNATASIGSDIERTTVSVTPRTNGDDTVTLICRLAILAEGGSQNREVTGVRRVRAGVRTLVLCLSEDEGPRRGARNAAAAPDPGKTAGYYLEVVARPRRPRPGAPKQ